MKSRETITELYVKINPNSTSGWTCMKSNGGKPLSYIRQLSDVKSEPPIDSAMVVLIENGAQCTIVCPFKKTKLQYFETHTIEIIPDNQARKSNIIGCRLVIGDCNLSRYSIEIDKREAQLVFSPGPHTFHIIIQDDGFLQIEKEI